MGAHRGEQDIALDSWEIKKKSAIWGHFCYFFSMRESFCYVFPVMRGGGFSRVLRPFPTFFPMWGPFCYVFHDIGAFFGLALPPPYENFCGGQCYQIHFYITKFSNTTAREQFTLIYYTQHTLLQRFPTGGEFPPRGEFSISQGGNSSLPRFKKNYAQYETEIILKLMICREPYRTN